MTASDAPTFITASTRAASASDVRWRRIAADAVSFHGAHGATAFHFCAIPVCSDVRSRATRCTSSIAARHPGEPYAGGGAGPDRDAEALHPPRAFANKISIGGTPG